MGRNLPPPDSSPGLQFPLIILLDVRIVSVSSKKPNWADINLGSITNKTMIPIISKTITLEYLDLSIDAHRLLECSIEELLV